ncbi:uncharacterized protein LOC125941972, partial [Dermacentor silvarum]|uniref:uncharacterized protein LOC125941972 n=1 Tax=Dermacentor silvarum TaxID=543639 RepID=UPI0021008407
MLGPVLSCCLGTFLGHRIDANGLRHKDQNIKAVREAPEPTSVSEMKASLGLVNHNGKFLPNLATLLAPPYALLAKGFRDATCSGTCDMASDPGTLEPSGPANSGAGPVDGHMVL